jgi:hypothetical protein
MTLASTTTNNLMQPPALKQALSYQWFEVPRERVWTGDDPNNAEATGLIVPTSTPRHLRILHPARHSPTVRDKYREHVPYRAGYRKGHKGLPPNAPTYGFSCIACLDHRFAISIVRFSGYLASLLFEHQCNQC